MDDHDLSPKECRRRRDRARRVAMSPRQRAAINKRRRDSYAGKRLFMTPEEKKEKTRQSKRDYRKRAKEQQVAPKRTLATPIPSLHLMYLERKILGLHLMTLLLVFRHNHLLLTSRIQCLHMVGRQRHMPPWKRTIAMRTSYLRTTRKRMRGTFLEAKNLMIGKLMRMSISRRLMKIPTNPMYQIHMMRFMPMSLT
uniref:Uncharacterized protein n=1 Tax=Setaria viridis TaxID=4556 RepID=A0A4U6V2K0_SETVI|nr:hypothetical protein SEVIR_4G125802v2 [Setaria viridis]